MLGRRAKEAISYSLRSNIAKIIDYAFGYKYMIAFSPITKDLNAHCAVVTFECQEYGEYITYKNDRNKLKEIERKRYEQLKRRIEQLTGTFDENRIYIENDSLTTRDVPNKFHYMLQLNECLKIYNKEKTKHKEYKSFDTKNLDNVLVNKAKCIEFEQVYNLSNLDKEKIKDFVNLIRYNSFGIENLGRGQCSPLYGVDFYRDNNNYHLYIAVGNKHKEIVLNSLNNLMQNMFCINENPDVYRLHKHTTTIQYSISKDDFVNIITLCKMAGQSIKALLMKGEIK